MVARLDASITTQAARIDGGWNLAPGRDMQNMDRSRHFIGNMHPCAVLKEVCVQRDECILLVWRMMPEIFLNQWVSQAIGKRKLPSHLSLFASNRKVRRHSIRRQKPA